MRIIVRGHSKPVGAGAHDGEQIPTPRPGDLTVFGKEVAALADRPDDVSNDLFAVFFNHRLNQDNESSRLLFSGSPPAHDPDIRAPAPKRRRTAKATSTASRCGSPRRPLPDSASRRPSCNSPMSA